MADFCTCGTALVPDARFCHKCGRPTRPLTEAEAEEEIQPAPPVIAAPPPVEVPVRPEVGFRNPVAVRIGLLVALVCFFVSALSGPIVILPLFWLVASGFASVYLYGRRTGFPLSLASGARLGWMTGLFAFVILLVLFTTIVFALSDEGFAARAVTEMRARGADANVEQVMEVFRNPASVVQILLVSFVVFTVFPTLGGALGAKLLSGRTTRPL